MKRALKLSLSFAVCMAFLVSNVTSNVVFREPAIASTVGPGGPPASDQPPDKGPYNRRVIPQDNIAQPLSPRIRVRDIVVSNTDPNLTNIDTVDDSEPSIAIDPTVTDQMVITAFSGNWSDAGDPAPLWYSGDGGITWTKKFSIPPPPGVTEAPGCPCDQTVDYGRGSVLYGTFLTAHSATTANVYSGSTTKPLRLSFWNWWLAGGTPQRTNFYGFNNTDQPWVLINRDPDNINQDNVYVGYDDFLDRNQRVSAAVPASNPPVFTSTRDNSTSGGVDCCGINPGHRLAVNPNNGYIYSIFQVYRAAGSGGSANIDFMLNRSTNGGTSWGVNGSPGGIVIANADSTQPTPKFGTVNALLGGVDHAAVDPTTGDVYYVYGNRDPGTGNNRLGIARIQDNGAGGMTVLSTSFVTGQVQAALPSAAVNSTGVVGVLYDTFDGFSGGPPPNYPIFTAHFGVSTDHGVTFSDNLLLTFLSPATDNFFSNQRVLGDYQQSKAVGADFVGVFSGTGASFGRTLINIDPIFFRITLL